MFSHTRALTFVLAVLCAVALGEAEASRRSVSCECRPASGGRYNLDVTWRNLPTTRPNYFVLQEHSTYVESCDAIVTKVRCLPALALNATPSLIIRFVPVAFADNYAVDGEFVERQNVLLHWQGKNRCEPSPLLQRLARHAI